MTGWPLGVSVVGGTALASLAGHWVFTKAVKKRFSVDDLNMAVQYAAIIATLNSLLLAFIAVSVWEAHDAADDATLNEGTSVEMALRDLQAYGGRRTAGVREELRQYGRCVIDEEWALLARERPSTRCGAELGDAFMSLSRVEPRSQRDGVIFQATWARLNDVAKFRRERLLASGSRVPRSLWIVVIIGTALTLAACVTMPWSRFGRWMVIIVAACHGLVFFFIADFNTPFEGRDAVTPDALEQALATVQPAAVPAP